MSERGSQETYHKEGRRGVIWVGYQLKKSREILKMRKKGRHNKGEV